MAKRRKEDPEFLEKQKELSRSRMAKKRLDENYNKKHKEYCTEYNHKKKQEFEDMKLKLKVLEETKI